MTAYLITLLTILPLWLDEIYEPMPSTPEFALPLIALLVVAVVLLTALLVRHFRKK